MFQSILIEDNTNLTVQLIRTDAKPGSRGLRLSVGGGVSSQQIQSPQSVNVEVFLQLQSSLQDADGVGRLLFQLRAREEIYFLHLKCE